VWHVIGTLNMLIKYTYIYIYIYGFANSSFRSVLLAFSQFYVKHDLKKNKIVIHFFC
jgi:hypothetical protein